MESFSVNHFPKSRVRLPSSPRHFTPLILSLCSLSLSHCLLSLNKTRATPSRSPPPPTTLCRSPRKVSRLLRSGLLDEASRSGASRRSFAVGFATRLCQSGASSIWASPIWASRWASQRGGLWVR